MNSQLSDKGLLAESIVSRMKSVLGVKMDKDVAAYFGIKQASVHNWKARGSVPYEQCVQMAMSKGVSLDWLILGKDDDGHQNEELGAVFVDPAYIEVPLYDIQASAGPGKLFDQEFIKSYRKFRRDWIASEGLYEKDLLCLEISGDSMDGTLSDTDVVLVNKAKRTPDGVFVLRVGDDLRVKRLQKLTDGSLRVSSDNEMYAPEVILLENLNQVEIIGHCHSRSGRVF